MENFFNSKSLRWPIRAIALTGTVALMGVTMPSCPGQQAMQDQIDAMKASQAEIMKRTQAHETELKQIVDAINQLKTESQGVGASAGQLKAEIDQLKTAVQSIETRLAAAKPAKSTGKYSSKPARRR
ncbi:MAG: hypothetical protein P4M08_03775 [Oligoflexia bacterium]|nr:hypothetical protein [Oligoflexia bacterium]